MNYLTVLIIMLPAILLTLYAQFKVTVTYNKYLKIISQDGRPAHEIARNLLDRAGLQNVKITITHGYLGDHYNDRTKTVALSESNYHSSSISAIGVACHEVGHALQYQQGYGLIKLRNALIPICNFGSSITWILIMLGILFYYTTFGSIFLWLGVIIFALFVILNLVTLPIEFNASTRARQLLMTNGIFNDAELTAVKSVLDSAALTYVANLLLSLVNLLRLLLLLFSNRD